MRVYVFILILSLLPPAFLKAQHPYYYTLNEENGLPSNEVYRIAQDSLGYMWIGCSAGLYRYNGIQYKAFTHSSMNSRGISGLRFDRQGKLWCYNFTGQIFFVRHDSLLLFKDYSSRCKSFPHFCFDKQGRIWVTADTAVEVLNEQGQVLQQFNQYKTEQGLPMQWNETECDQAGTVFIHSINGGLWKWVPAQPGRLQFISNHTVRGKLNTRGTFRFIGSSLYLLTESNPLRSYELWKLGKEEPQHMGKIELAAEGDILYSVAPGPHNDWMLLSSAGVLRTDKNLTGKKDKVLFPSEKISDMLRDREGSYWFSSLQSGIMVIPSIDLELYNSQHSTLKDDNISTLKILDSGVLLLGTYRGIMYRLDTRQQQPMLYMNTQPNLYRQVRKIKAYGNKLYIARGAFSVISGKEERITSMWNTRDFDFMNDSIYFATSDQIVCAPIHLTDNKAVRNIRAKGGFAILCDSSTQSVYFACNDGLFRLRKEQLSEIKHRQLPVYATSLQIRQRQLWIGSIAEGILLYNLDQEDFEGSYTQSNGLCSNNIRGLNAEGNRIWVTTEKCLNLLEPGEPVRAFSFAEGLLSKQVNAIEVLNDTAWIASNKGLLRMPVHMASENNVAPGVGIARFYVNDRARSCDSSLQLYWHENNIRISFEGLALRSRGSFQYKYRLLENDSHWTYTSSADNSVRYNSLGPGNYCFELLCINEDGISGKPARICFSIARPYWQQWWFYLLLFFILATATYLLFTLRLRLLKKRAETQNQLVLSQLTALKAQMNPHFMYNTLNSIQDLIVQQDIKSTNYYLSQFGSLMRKVLDASGNEQIQLSEETEILQLYLALEKLRFGEQFSYNIHIPEELDQERVFIPSMIIQPFVENAIKHGLLHKPGNKFLHISFSLNEKELLCRIRDNGIGREKAAEIKARASRTHRSFATAATEKRLELINNTRTEKIRLEIIDLKEAGMASGTEVLIHIPI